MIKWWKLFNRKRSVEKYWEELAPYRATRLYHLEQVEDGLYQAYHMGRKIEEPMSRWKAIGLIYRLRHQETAPWE